VPMPQLSLRVRLALGYSLFFGAVLIILIAGVYWFVRATLYAEISRDLHTSAELIQRDFAASAGPLRQYFRGPETALRALPPGIQGLESPTLYVQVSAPDGATEVTSASLSGQTLLYDAGAHQAALAGQTTEAVVPLGVARVLQLTVPLSSAGQTLGVLKVAEPLQGLDRTLDALLMGLSITAIVALLAAIQGGAWIARRALRPVEEIAHTARQIVEASDLARRVPSAPSADEIGALTTTVNDMLARLELLFSAQRRLIADVGHELRTPLTAMRGHMELLQRGIVTDEQARAETMTDILREVSRLGRMANDLLLLAQAEVGLQIRREHVALDELVLEVVRELRPLADHVTLRPRLGEQVAVFGDRDRLKQALLNLVANAIQHTPSGGSITVALDLEPSAAIIQVQDTGSGIAAEDLPHVFRRFYQADRARTQRVGGAGLGLAIVQWVADAHSGTIQVVSRPAEGATFILRLPRTTLA
jgi:two-component system, OmpR family, sensor kinase